MSIVNMMSQDEFRATVAQANRVYVWCRLHPNDAGRYIEVGKHDVLSEANVWGGNVKAHEVQETGHVFIGAAG